MIRGGKKHNWCTQDCHDAPQWCRRNPCLSKEDYKAKQKERELKKQSDKDKMKNNPDFRTALLAACKSEEAFKELEEQFLN